MNRGGAETWLLNVLKHVNRDRVAMDFLAHYPEPGAYDSEIGGYGARIFLCPGHRNLFRQWYGLWRLQRSGRYDVVHSHVDFYGGLVVLLAWLVGVRARIANSHNDTREVDHDSSFGRRAYIRTMKFLVRRFATGGIGTSNSAAKTLFGEDWCGDLRWRVHPACVDLQPFHEGVDRDAIRRQLGIPPDAIVLGHVGRFVEQKNHEFLIQIAKTMEPWNRVKFLLVGGGPLQRGIESTIREQGLQDRFIILPPRDDIPRLMLGAMDFFLFPSRCEGLGLALVESQAAGLRSFASTAVPPEAIVVPSLVQQLPLSAGPECWAKAILRQIDSPSPVTQEEALRAVERSFDIRQNAARLVEYYQAAAS